MHRSPLLRFMSSALWLALIALLPMSAIALFWANSTGLPEDWRKAIEAEISKKGVHVEIASLTYIPLRGFSAGNLRVFAEPERIHEISRFEQVRFALDYSQLAQGAFRLRKIALHNARLSLPVDPEQPLGAALHVSDLQGTILMQGERKIEIKDAQGDVGGVKVSLNADLLVKASSASKAEDERGKDKRRELIAKLVSEMKNWSFGLGDAPSVRLELTGDLSDKNSLHADFQIQAPSIEKKQYRLQDLSAYGSVDGYLLEISSLSARDARGEIRSHAEYQISDQEGRFDIESSINLPRLMKSWMGLSLKQIELLVAGKQSFEATGDFKLEKAKKLELSLTGKAVCESVMFRGVNFDSLQTSFSWQAGNLFLPDLTLQRSDSLVLAKVMTEGSKIRMSLHSTLPVPLYESFFPEQPLEKIVANFTENKNASTEIFLEGSIDAKNPRMWHFEGHGNLRNLSYRGVPITSAACEFTVNRQELDFREGTLVFDYSNYPLRRDFEGPSTGTAEFDRIRYVSASKTIAVEAVRGDFWISPMIRCFAVKIADSLERYRFHRPPSLKGSGVIDVTRQGRTELKVNFSSDSMADYQFLGANLTLSSPSGQVEIQGDQVKVSDLSLGVFQGKIAGNILYAGKSNISCDMNWTKLAMADLSSAYDFKMKGAGLLTGRLNFTLPEADIAKMEGQGLVGLEDGEIFSIPIFGPLSPLVSTVLSDKAAGFERASSAFCNYTIQSGVLRTNNFQTESKSLHFTGDGQVGLKEKTIDFTIRLNARGLLGLITLPLRPFYGLFQFRGTGPLSNTKWENVRFTSPSEEQSKLLNAATPKAQIIQESPAASP